MYDPLYEEIVTNTSDLMVYLARHIFLEIFLPLSIFMGVMLTMFVDWNWMNLSINDQARTRSLEEAKKNLLE